VLREIWDAYLGRRAWDGLQRRYQVDEGLYVVLMPEDDAELNAAALGHIHDLVADRRARGVVLVRTGSSQVVSPPSSGVLATESWTDRKIDALLRSYELDNFSDRLLVVSLTRPFGNALHSLLGRQGITVEDLVCLGCLRLRSYGAAVT
jgi:hypothetical protein